MENSFLLVTHDREEARSLANMILSIHHGTITKEEQLQEDYK